MPTFLVSV